MLNFFPSPSLTPDADTSTEEIVRTTVVAAADAAVRCRVGVSGDVCVRAAPLGSVRLLLSLRHRRGFGPIGGRIVVPVRYAVAVGVGAGGSRRGKSGLIGRIFAVGSRWGW